MNNRSFHEIDHLTIKLWVGTIAVLLPWLVRFAAGHVLPSVSGSYWAGDWPRNFFVGALIAIAALISAYNGDRPLDLVMAKVAAVAAAGTSLFPSDPTKIVWPRCHATLHYVAGGVLFVILTYFCIAFFRKARMKSAREAKRRMGVYLLCAVAIMGAIAILLIDIVLDMLLHNDWLDTHFPWLFFYAEAAALTAFGVSWLTASHVLPYLNAPEERYHADILRRRQVV
ncbi:hypothetical protein [Rhodanobacter sp. C01]|uniref:hypothetical protein n=1 Tax=Rhodanobacter sp. C01 TaxID=1945856 RepID=UPI00098426AA|nr:hypothetical protein [Rhodanobacter sp. C01]OOG49132.1 hypothetical protein B0E50_06965 [Rhodanobacter sp. C01]